MGMYADYILFSVSAFMTVAAVAIGLYLFNSRKKSKLFNQTLKMDTTQYDALQHLSSLIKKTTGNASKSDANFDFSQALNPLLTATVSDQTECTEAISSDNCMPVKAYTATQTTMENVLNSGLDIRELSARYTITDELSGGAMSRVFRARHNQLGNVWIVKYIDNRIASLSNEDNILKQLNHINLPQIVDIYHNQSGVFLVERYIEGCSLDKIIQISKNKITENVICDWGLQMAQVLNYLHTQPNPIIHSDLKPSNLMVTHDNKLVLIDFGISRQRGETNLKAGGLTYAYAAPEQFRAAKSMKAIDIFKLRFGSDCAKQVSKTVDERSDIFSFGMILFELAMGYVPIHTRNINNIKTQVSNELSEIILKCLSINADERFQSMGDVIKAFDNIRLSRVSMVKTLTTRRFAAAALTLLLVGSICTTAFGAYINRQETLSVVAVEPYTATVSMQQSVSIFISKTSPDGNSSYIDTDMLEWSTPDDNIARIEGNRLAGYNKGETTIYGKYRNQLVQMEVNVVDRMDNTVDIALSYENNTSISTWAADTQFDWPESITSFGDGRVAVADNGTLRIISDKSDNLRSIVFDPAYLSASLVRASENDIYVLTDEWIDEDDQTYYGIMHVDSNDSIEMLYYTEAVYTNIPDFCISGSGTIYFIQQNVQTDQTLLMSMDTKTGDVSILNELPAGTDSICYSKNMHNEDVVYMANSEKGIILKENIIKQQLEYIAGTEDNNHFVDGAAALFYKPSRIRAIEDRLYVLDFNIIRCIKLNQDGNAITTYSVVGEPSPSDCLSDFELINDEILATNPKSGSIIYVK